VSTIGHIRGPLPHRRSASIDRWAVVLSMGRRSTGARQLDWHYTYGKREKAEHLRAKLVAAIDTGTYV